MTVIIDIHTHIVPPWIKEDRDKYCTDPLFNQLYASPKAVLATAKDLISSMDKAGVDISVALNIGWSNTQLCRETNDYIIEVTAVNPQRIIGFGTVYLGELSSAIKEINRCARAGLRGIGEMRLNRKLFALENVRLQKFIEALTVNNLALLLHCSEPVGHDYTGKGDTTPELIYRLIERFPELTLICAHWGGGLPFYALMPEVKRSLTNVVFDTSASRFLYSPEIYRLVTEIIGSGSIVFGTDFPLLSQARSLSEMRSAKLPVEAENRIVSLNAQRLLGISTR